MSITAISVTFAMVTSVFQPDPSQYPLGFVKEELALTEALQVSGSFPEIRAKGDCERMKRSRKIVRKVCDTTCFLHSNCLSNCFQAQAPEGAVIHQQVS